MEFKKVLFSIIIVSMVMVSVGLIINGWRVYNPAISNDLTGEFNELDTMAGYSESYKGNINPQSGEASSDYEAETFRGGYGIITNIFPALRTVYGSGGMLDKIAERFSIPVYIIQGIVAMFIFAIVFGIVAIVFRLGRTSG